MWPPRAANRAHKTTMKQPFQSSNPPDILILDLFWPERAKIGPKSGPDFGQILDQNGHISDHAHQYCPNVTGD